MTALTPSAQRTSITWLPRHMQWKPDLTILKDSRSSAISSLRVTARRTAAPIGLPPLTPPSRRSTPGTSLWWAAWSRDRSVLRRVQGDEAWRAPLDPLGTPASGRTGSTSPAGRGIRRHLRVPHARARRGVVGARRWGDGYGAALGAARGEDALAPRTDGASRRAAVCDRRRHDRRRTAATPVRFLLAAVPHVGVEVDEPRDGLPEAGRFEWCAPGGRGHHSLPPDFQPGDIEPVRGARVLVVTGPKAPTGFGFVRVLGAARMFDVLRASVGDVRRLSREEGRVRRRGSRRRLVLGGWCRMGFERPSLGDARSGTRRGRWVSCSHLGGGEPPDATRRTSNSRRAPACLPVAGVRVPRPGASARHRCPGHDAAQLELREVM
jgi:hypothetical protein